MAYFINRQAPMSGISGLLALKGRQGDSELVHMSKPEINMLKSMGQLTVNPRTGLPEAFNLEEIFRGISGLMQQPTITSGKEAMQELMNFGRNKIADYNAGPEEMEMPVEQPTMPIQPPQQEMAMQPPMPPQQPPMDDMSGLPAMLAAGKTVGGPVAEVGRTGPDGAFEGMIDVDNNGGNGMSDDIPFKVQGDPVIKNALLSRDEYVIPADVVSNLGNGSSDSGAEKLDKFLNDVREDSTGTTKQIKQINGDKKLEELR
jgi:hypothetical protein